MLTFSVVTDFLLILGDSTRSIHLYWLLTYLISKHEHTQKFIAAYYKLKEDGTPEENVYPAALEVLNAASTRKASSGSMASSFQEAQRDTSVNIKDIFKD